MSFTYDGNTWEPETTSEHASNIIEKINTLLQENQIYDLEGNIAQLKENYGNALYLLALGAGDRIAANDNKLTAAINSFNIELCDDQQINNLLPIASVSRNPGSYSTLKLTVTASTSGTCTIPAGTKAPYNDVNFVTQHDVAISAGATQVIDTVCDTIGPIAVLTGEINAFENPIANLETVINNESSVPGVAAETTSELRQRLIKGNTIKYTLEGCKQALEELTGVTYARVYFNYNTKEEIELPGGVILQPRKAYVVIHGSSDQIAYVYSEYMSAETQNAPGATTTAKSQDWVTSSGQTISIKYDDATEEEIYVQVNLKSDAEYGNQVTNQIKRDLIVASSEWNIGESITGLKAGAPFVDCTYTDVAYVKVSTDGENWVDLIELGCNVIPRISDSTISVEILED